MSRSIVVGLVGSVLFSAACESKRPAAAGAAAEQPVVSAPSAPEPAAAAPASPVSGTAKLGEKAPDFELPDLDGKTVKLSSFLGKTVVLEWFNPECPFVKNSHTKGSLVGTAEKHQKAGVVWLAINSGAPGKQGTGVEKNRAAKASFGFTNPILLDETGAVGKAYDAKRTPHLYVIDPNGVLVYRGAIDNSPDGEGESPEGGKLVNYVDAALADLAAGRPVSKPETEAYGCSVKYGS
jgi:peroxiredoxin